MTPPSGGNSPTVSSAATEQLALPNYSKRNTVMGAGTMTAGMQGMQRIVNANAVAETESRTESARKVLEARRQKQKGDAPLPTTSSNPDLSPTISSGFSQMLSGKVLEGIHDVLTLMDTKVEALITDVNMMRADLQGVQVDSPQAKLDQLQQQVDRGFAALYAQLKHMHARPRERPSGDDLHCAASIPESRAVELILHEKEGRHRTSSSVVDRISQMSAESGTACTQALSEVELDNMVTEDLIVCSDVQEDSFRNSAASNAGHSPGPAPSRTSHAHPEQPEKDLQPVSQEASRRSSHMSALQKSPRPSSRLSGRVGTRRSSGNEAAHVKFSLKDLQKQKTSHASEMPHFFVKPRQRSSAQKWIWNLLEDPDLVRGGRSYGNFLSFLIFVSAVLPIVPLGDTGETETSLRMAISYGLFVVDIIFFLEVVSRFYGSPHRVRFFTSIHNWLDIISVVVPIGLKIHLNSFTLAADMHHNVVGVELGLIVMVPVIHLLKLLRRFENSHLIKQAFREAIGALPSLLYCMMVLVVGFSAIIYVVEPRNNIETMPRAIWFTMVTLTTVGYGDVVPVSPGGNMVVCVLMIVSAMYMAMPLGIVGKAFGSVWDDRHRLLLMERLRTRFSTVGYDPQDIPGLFCSYDENGDGELSMEEFRQMLQQLEVEAKDERAHDVFAAFDNDGSGAIDDMEFIKTLFPSAFKSMYNEGKNPNPDEEGDVANEGSPEERGSN